MAAIAQTTAPREAEPTYADVNRDIIKTLDPPGKGWFLGMAVILTGLAIGRGLRHAIEHELGDVLFAIANLGRKLNTPSEDALRMTNKRFTSRFHRVEEKLAAAGIPFGEATLEVMDGFWDEAKAEERAASALRSTT